MPEIENEVTFTLPACKALLHLQHDSEETVALVLDAVLTKEQIATLAWLTSHICDVQLEVSMKLVEV